MERSAEEAERRVLDGTSWREFCDILKFAGEVVLGEGTPPSAFDRAEGFRYLSRITRAALETFVEHADPRAPVLQRVVHETAKMGADNPDNYYQNAAISGAFEYRIRGTRGTVAHLSFATQIGNYGQGAGMPPSGRLHANDLVIADDGTFEIAVSCDPRPGNWLPMTPETGTLIIRQTFLDREHEQRAELAIERVDGVMRPAPLTPRALDAGLTSAAMLVGGASRLFQSWAEGFEQHTNELPQFDPDTSTAFGGDPAIAYYHSYWKLAPDEALVIEVAPPECEYWNFQVNNHWMESLDYRYARIHINKHTASYNRDGSVQVVVSAQDPGHPNWLETLGHDRGTMCWRWTRAAHHPQPTTRVVKLSSLRGA